MRSPTVSSPVLSLREQTLERSLEQDCPRTPSVSRHERAVETSFNRMKLVKFKDLDEWQRDNPAIVSGYRPLQHSYLKCLATIPALHNESVNIVGLFPLFLSLSRAHSGSDRNSGPISSER